MTMQQATPGNDTIDARFVCDRQQLLAILHPLSMVTTEHVTLSADGANMNVRLQHGTWGWSTVINAQQAVGSLTLWYDELIAGLRITDSGSSGRLVIQRSTSGAVHMGMTDEPLILSFADVERHETRVHSVVVSSGSFISALSPSFLVPAAPWDSQRALVVKIDHSDVVLYVCDGRTTATPLEVFRSAPSVEDLSLSLPPTDVARAAADWQAPKLEISWASADVVRQVTLRCGDVTVEVPLLTDNGVTAHSK